jgi:hypothetical protein
LQTPEQHSFPSTGHASPFARQSTHAPFLQRPEQHSPDPSHAAAASLHATHASRSKSHRLPQHWSFPEHSTPSEKQSGLLHVPLRQTSSPQQGASAPHFACSRPQVLPHLPLPEERSQKFLQQSSLASHSKPSSKQMSSEHFPFLQTPVQHCAPTRHGSLTMPQATPPQTSLVHVPAPGQQSLSSLHRTPRRVQQDLSMRLQSFCPATKPQQSSRLPHASKLHTGGVSRQRRAEAQRLWQSLSENVSSHFWRTPASAYVSSLVVISRHAAPSSS